MKYYDVHHFADIQISYVSKSIKHLNKDINGLDIQIIGLMVTTSLLTLPSYGFKKVLSK